MKRFLFFLVITVLAGFPCLAQEEASVSHRILQIEKDLENPEGLRMSRYRGYITALRTNLTDQKKEIEQKIRNMERNMEIVRSVVENVDPPPAEIQEQIEELNAGIKALKTSTIDVNLMLVRIDEIEERINDIIKDRILSDVTVKHSFPFSPSFIKRALPDIISTFRFAVTEPYLWAVSSIKEQNGMNIRNILYLAVSIILAIVAVFAVRKMMLKHLNYRSDIEEPTYTSKLIAAFIEAVSEGIFPATILGVIYYWLSEYSESLQQGALGAAVLGGIGIIIYLVLIASFAKAVFSPNMINWRLVFLNRRQAKTVYTIIMVLAVAFGFHVFFFNILTQIEASEYSIALFTVIMNIVETFLCFRLLRHRLWEKEAKKNQFSEGIEETAKASREGVNLWRIVRSLMSMIIIASGAASLIGYVGLGDFIIKRILYSTVAASLVLVVRSFFHEMTLIFVQSQYAFATLGLNVKKLKVFRFWVLLFMDFSLLCLGAYVILPLWGVAQTDIINVGKKLVTGFSVGGVTVSFVNIIMAILVFFVVSKIFSYLLTWIKEKIFPETDMEKSLQNSLSAGVGYIGVIMAFIMSISVLGISFTNLAIVAGALSVGIGFGLQNIVNNFVSGIIILLERPIKVGDWIIINGNEGIVSRISFRATEIETWRKASILIPNAEIISNVLLNWTHNNHYGRVDIPIAVTHSSNVDRVKELLIEIAGQNNRVLFVPSPMVMLVGIDEDSLKFELRFFIPDVMSSLSIASEIRFSIIRRFREEGIEIPYRHQVMLVKNSGKTEEHPFIQPEITVAENSDKAETGETENKKV